VGCGTKKQPEGSGFWPARELYTGVPTRWSLEEAERTCDVVYVMSGKHHLLPLHREVEWYDQKVPSRRAPREAWAKEVVRGLVERYGGERIHVVLYGGKEYATVAEFLPAGWTCEQPMQGLEVGERLHFLKVRREAAARGEEMGQERVDRGAHFTVVRAAQLRPGDELDRVLSDRSPHPTSQIREVVVEGAEIVVRAVAQGRRVEKRFAPRDPVVVKGRQGLTRPMLGEAPAHGPAPARQSVEAAIAEWANRAAPHLSPGHRESLTDAMVASGSGRAGKVTSAMVGEALLAAGGADGAFSQRLEAAGVSEPARRAFDSFWLAQADQELAGAVGRPEPFWTVPLPASARLVVVTDRAVDALAYHQGEGREGTVYVAAGGVLEGARAEAVREMLVEVLRRDGEKGMSPMVVAAFGASMDGTLQAKALRALRPAGMAFDRHAPPRGRWGDRFASAERSVERERGPSIGS
jgi:hypothetical protein